MASNPPVAVYDACVLYPFHLRNILVQCAFDGLVEARWTEEIHDEWIRNLAANAPGLSIDRLKPTRDRMNAVLPEAVVAGYRPLMDQLTLPDPDDRHFLAAAIAAKASVIVTWNVKDFPARNLLAHGLTSKSPDDFLTGLHAAFPEALISSVSSARHNLRKTIPSVDAFVDALHQSGLKKFSAVLRRKMNVLK